MWSVRSVVGVKNDINVFEHTLEPVVFHAPEAAGGAAQEAGASEGRAAQDKTGGGPAVEPPSRAGASPRSVGEGSVGEAARERTPSAEEVNMERLFTLVSVAVALLGIAAGWVWFSRRPLYEMPRLLENKYYVDEIYDAAVIEPIKTGSRGELGRPKLTPRACYESFSAFLREDGARV